jgi:hypothetical protein
MRDNHRYWSFLSMGKKNYPHYHIWVTWKMWTLLKVIQENFFSLSLYEYEINDWSSRWCCWFSSLTLSLFRSRFSSFQFQSNKMMMDQSTTINKLLRAFQFRKHIKGKIHVSIVVILQRSNMFLIISRIEKKKVVLITYSYVHIISSVNIDMCSWKRKKKKKI